jgi:hypothetical protein
MQDKNLIDEELKKNEEVLYTSKELEGILFGEKEISVKDDFLFLESDKLNVSVLKYRKLSNKTCIKLLASGNVLNRLILDTIKVIKINSDHIVFDLNKNIVLETNIYLNDNNDTIVKIKFLNESE